MRGASPPLADEQTCKWRNDEIVIKTLNFTNIREFRLDALDLCWP